jgi:hypothetical protein
MLQRAECSAPGAAAGNQLGQREAGGCQEQEEHHFAAVKIG